MDNGGRYVAPRGVPPKESAALGLQSVKFIVIGAEEEHAFEDSGRGADRPIGAVPPKRLAPFGLPIVEAAIVGSYINHTLLDQG
jgi:hypothetical protein